MYSYADGLRAVELYIRFGKRLNATIRIAASQFSQSVQKHISKILVRSEGRTTRRD